MAFVGPASMNMDAKGRIAVPAKHRDALTVNGEQEVVLTAHPHRCLLLYPIEQWTPIQESLTKLSSLNPKVSGLQRLALGLADVLSLDSAGRLLISNAHKDYARLGKEIVMLGMGSHFEIWDAAAYQAQQQAYLDSGAAEEAGQLDDELKGFTF